jgi:hypothetical protein
MSAVKLVGVLREVKLEIRIWRSRPSVRLSVCEYDPLNPLLDFYDFFYVIPLQKICQVGKSFVIIG